MGKNVGVAQLNPIAEEWARRAIQDGDVDTSPSWSFEPADSDELLGDPPDWRRYRNYFLGHEPGENPDTKEAWKYPFAKSVAGTPRVFRSGLEAARHRSAQQGANDIFEAAGRLLAEIEEARVAR